jgi:hypothetical protein
VLRYERIDQGLDKGPPPAEGVSDRENHCAQRRRGGSGLGWRGCCQRVMRGGGTGVGDGASESGELVSPHGVDNAR